MLRAVAGELLIDEPADGVLRLTISNPSKRNALDLAILDAIAEAVADADGRGGVGCILLTGADGMFSSGYDLGGIPDGARSRPFLPAASGAGPRISVSAFRARNDSWSMSSIGWFQRRSMRGFSEAV